jgi:NitT/TauT family transport system permease protein
MADIAQNLSQTLPGAGEKGTDAAAIVPRPTVNTSEKVLRIVVPLVSLLLAILAWHLFVTINEVPRYIIPSPADVWDAFFTDSGTLWPALLVTARITLLALALALIGGWALAILIVASRWFELAVFPFAVILQVTPMIAIAPLLLIYAPNTQTALLICAFIVAFFPILANVVQGLKSVDHNLLNLFELYGAKPWQTLFLLKVPAASPYFMTGLRIGGGLALIAAVVAEFAAGSAGQGAGLAFRLIEAQYRLNLPRLFVALVMLCGLGITIYAITSFISWLVLHRWHESAMRREN